MRAACTAHLRSRRSAIAAACLVTAFGWPSAFLEPAPVWAGAPTEQIKASVDQVLKVLEDPRLKQESMTAERRAAIRRAAESIFDFTETGRRALGRHWQSLNEQERQEFVSVFTDLLERSYASRMEKYSGERIIYAGDTVEGDTATVRTKLITKQGQEIPIDYRLHRQGEKWLVYDVFVEGVSLVANYRTQFDRIMQTASYQELIRKMKARQAEFSAPGGPEKGGRAPKS